MTSVLVLTVLLAISATAFATYAYDGGEEYGPKRYNFEYGVNDPHTGDKKEQQEQKDGKHVKGSYSFKEADGTVRVVEYVAGPHSGFNAVVKRIGHAQHPAHYGPGGSGGYGGATSYVGTTHFGYQY